MNHPNLLPKPIKERLIQKRRLMLWLRSAGIVCALGIMGCVAAGVYLGDMDAPVRERLLEVNSVINQLDASEAAAWTRIETVTHELGVAEDIAGQPDWRILLDVIAAGLSDGDYLEQIQTALVLDRDQKVAPPSKAASGPYRVTIRGVTMLQGDATRYAVYLEKCRLFDSVRLVATLPRPDIDGSAVGFEIACEIGIIAEKSK